MQDSKSKEYVLVDVCAVAKEFRLQDGVAWHDGIGLNITENVVTLWRGSFVD